MSHARTSRSTLRGVVILPLTLAALFFMAPPPLGAQDADGPDPDGPRTDSPDTGAPDSDAPGTDAPGTDVPEPGGGPAPELTPPVLRDFVEAEYPEAAREAGLEAAVVLEITIAIDGVVTDARVVEPVGNGFDEAALEAVQRFVFEPARRGQEAIAARIRYQYVFELREQEPPPPEEDAEPAPGRLEGRVLGAEDGDPIVAAEVYVSSADGLLNRRAVTGEDGAFRFDELPPGTYGVRVVGNEYGDLEAEEEVASNEATDVTYRVEILEDDTVEFSARAVIRAPPREVVRRTITREELTRVPGTRGDALRTVELLPGVGRPPFGGGVLIVRGSAPQDSQVYLDGAPVPLLYHFGGLTSFYNSRLLEQIDFFPGNFSARYGRKMGGILDVTSRDPASDGIHGVADLNILDSSLYIEGPVGEDASVAIAGRRSYIDFFFENIVPESAFDVVAAPVYYDYQLMATWRPTDQDRFRLVGYGSSDEFRVVFSDPADADPSVRGNLDLRTQFHKLHLGWSRQLTGDIDQDVQVTFGPTQLRFGLGPDLSFQADFFPVDIRGEWTARLSPRFRIIAGLDIAWGHFDVSFRGPQPSQQEGGGDNNSLSSQEIVSLSSSGYFYRPATYAEIDLRPIDPLRIVVGLRLDYFKELESWTLDPRLVSVYSLDDQNRIKAGVGLFSQPPEFQESAAEFGNAELNPIHALHVGLGYERDLAEGISVGAELFYKSLWDRVVSTEGGLPPIFVNEGIGRIYGFELSGRVQPMGRRWFGFLSYTLSRSERRDLPSDGWRLFDFDQTHILSVAGVYRLGAGWEAGATFRLVSGNPSTPIVGGQFDGGSFLYEPIFGAQNSERGALFHRLDVRVEKQWRFESWSLALYLDVQNAYNSTNPEATLYNYNFTESTDVPGLPIIPSLGVRGEM